MGIYRDDGEEEVMLGYQIPTTNHQCYEAVWLGYTILVE